MFNEGILIDRNRLEEECSETPGYFDYWIRQETSAQTELENSDADFKKKLRRLEPSEINATYGLSIARVTEGVIDDLLRADSKHQDLKERYADAVSERKSYDKKIEMLKVLAMLHGQGYFAKIESSRPAMDNMAKEIKKKIAESIRTRKAERDAERKPSRPRR